MQALRVAYEIDDPKYIPMEQVDEESKFCYEDVLNRINLTTEIFNDEILLEHSNDEISVEYPNDEISVEHSNDEPNKISTHSPNKTKSLRKMYRHMEIEQSTRRYCILL